VEINKEYIESVIGLEIDDFKVEELMDCEDIINVKVKPKVLPKYINISIKIDKTDV
jgi:hypothetical protein